MGEFSEDRNEYQDELGLCGSAPKRTHWRTRTGESIPIGKLGDEHLQNILRMLLRAALAYDGAVEELDVEFIEKEWPELVEEAEKRGLEWHS